MFPLVVLGGGKPPANDGWKPQQQHPPVGPNNGPPDHVMRNKWNDMGPSAGPPPGVGGPGHPGQPGSGGPPPPRDGMPPGRGGLDIGSGNDMNLPGGGWGSSGPRPQGPVVPNNHWGGGPPQSGGMQQQQQQQQQQQRWPDHESPTMPKRTGPSLDDPTGTSLWASNPKGNNHNNMGPGGGGGQGGSKWTDMPMPQMLRGGPGPNQRGPQMHQQQQQQQMQGGGHPGNKDGGWPGPAAPGGGAGRWMDQDTPGGGWNSSPNDQGDNNSMSKGGGSGWGAPGNSDGPIGPQVGGWANNKRGGAGNSPSWDDQGHMDGAGGGWGGGNPSKPDMNKLSKETIWGSKQFRLLCEMGFQKGEAESCLRQTNLRLEDALDLLNAHGRLRQQPAVPHNHHHGPPEHHYGGGAGPPPGPESAGGPGDLRGMHSYHEQQQPPIGANNANSSLPKGNPSPSPSNMIGPPGSNRGGPPMPPGAGGSHLSGGAGSQPSAQQLRILVQQIQMAVQAGHLNPQILNQPLAPQTLILLNQLLQQIKNLQTLQQQHSMTSRGNPNAPAVMNITVNITKAKQAIQNLQNQISAQQLTYLKGGSGGGNNNLGGGGGGPSHMQQQQHQQQQQQQQQQQHSSSSSAPGTGLGSTNSSVVRGGVGSVNDMFPDLNLSNDQSASSNQSRLSKWTTLKESSTTPPTSAVGLSSGFPKAPGTIKPSGNLLLPDEGPWGRNSADASNGGSGGWPDTSSGVHKPGSGVGGGSGAPGIGGDSGGDFGIPEFEPGKPWKGTGLKNPDDDPNLTPGSVAPTPLPIGPLSNKNVTSSVSSSVEASLGGLTSSTWSNMGIAKSDMSSKLSSSDWGNAPISSSSSPLTQIGQDLWGKSGAGRAPPGLGSNTGTSSSAGWPITSSASGSSNGWSNGGITIGDANSNGSNSGGAGGSSWLLLKNLTPQIDGSTLKTLCMQHGPLAVFDLYLSHSIALVAYSSGREAAKVRKKNIEFRAWT